MSNVNGLGVSLKGELMKGRDRKEGESTERRGCVGRKEREEQRRGKEDRGKMRGKRR